MNRLSRFVIIIFLLCFCLSFLCCSKEEEKSRDEESANLPDVIETAKIFPEVAYGNNRLEVKFDFAFRAKLPEYTYTWKRNGRIIPGVSGSSLGPDNFEKGDRDTSVKALRLATYEVGRIRQGVLLIDERFRWAENK